MKFLAAILALVFAATTGPAAALDLQGHRGARGLAPENTLPAFALALGIGVTTLELDIAITQDGVLVISHDPALNSDLTRSADGKFLEVGGPLIRDLTFEQLSRYDVGRIKPGTAYARRYPEQKPVDGTRLPRLADLFALVKKSGNEQVRFAIETKVTPTQPQETIAPEAFARAVIAAIREGGMAQRASVISFDWRTLAVVQKEAPEIDTVYITAQQDWLDNIGTRKGQSSAWTAGIQHRDHGSVPKMIKAAGGRYWSSYFGDLDAAQVQQAHALGIQVLAWTVNEPRLMARMIDMGLDGIVTDRPDLLREEMKRRGLALPVATAVVP